MFMTIAKNLSIEELAQASGLSVRTVRYYISEGIVEGPQGRGKNASYSDLHLLRLRVIRRLVENGVSLKEIKRTIPFLSFKELSGLLGKAATQRSAEEAARGTSPKAYVSALLERSRLARPEKRERILAAETFGIPENAAPQEHHPFPDQKTRWFRFEILPGLEIHAAEGKYKTYRTLIEKIIEELGGKNGK